MVSIAQTALVALPSLTCLVVSVLVSLATAVINFAAASATALFSSVEGSKNSQGPLNDQNNNRNPNDPNNYNSAFISLEAARASKGLVDSALPNPETGVLDPEAVVA